MKQRTCGREGEIQWAASSGRWTGALRAHLSECAPCRDVALVTTALAGDTTVAPRRVAPSILWAKARFARRRRAETVASNILIGSQVAIGLVGLTVVAYFGARLDIWSALDGGAWAPVLLGGAGLLLAGGLLTLRLITRRT